MDSDALLVIIHHFKFVFLWNFTNAHSAIVAERCENPWIDIGPFNAVNRIFVLIVSLKKTVRYSKIEIHEIKIQNIIRSHVTNLHAVLVSILVGCL